MEISSIRAQDSQEVLNLIKEGMEKSERDLTIYASDKCKNYIQYLVSAPPRLTGYYYFGYYTNQKLVGFTEWREFGDSFFLNNFYVSQEYRGQGIGKRLFQYGVQKAKQLDLEYLSLDVFNGNISRHWYEAIGFRTEWTKVWLVGHPRLESEEFPTKDNYRIMNYAQSMELLSRFGFANLELTSKNSCCKVGLIGNEYYRLDQPDFLLDPPLLGSLTDIDQKRKYLVICDRQEQIQLNGFKRIAISFRMKQHIDGVNKWD